MNDERMFGDPTTKCIFIDMHTEDSGGVYIGKLVKLGRFGKSSRNYCIYLTIVYSCCISYNFDFAHRSSIKGPH